MTTIIDSYNESNQDNTAFLATSSFTAIGQVFRTSVSFTLDSCQFYIEKNDVSPTGNVVAKLYTISGVFGAGAIPTGPALATSNVVNATTLPSSFALFTFTFSGSDRILVSPNDYCITVEYPGNGNEDAGFSVAVDEVGTHNGNIAIQIGGVWAGDPNEDTCFYVYGIVASDPLPSRLSKVVTWENRVQPFSIKTCIRCNKEIEKNPYQYLYCGNCRAPVVKTPKLPLPIEVITPEAVKMPSNPRPPEIKYVKFEKTPSVFSKKLNH